MHTHTHGDETNVTSLAEAVCQGSLPPVTLCCVGTTCFILATLLCFSLVICLKVSNGFLIFIIQY